MSTALFKKITPSIKALISQTVLGILEDPDFGLELSADARKRLQKIQRSKLKSISFSDIKRKYL